MRGCLSVSTVGFDFDVSVFERLRVCGAFSEVEVSVFDLLRVWMGLSGVSGLVSCLLLSSFLMCFLFVSSFFKPGKDLSLTVLEV